MGTHRKSVRSMKKQRSKATLPEGVDLSAQMIKEIRDARTELVTEIRGIESAFMPKILDLQIQAKDIVEHAIELWRMEQRLDKVAESIGEEDRVFFTHSIQKLKRYLDKNHIEVVGHTKQEFNDGVNVDVLLFKESSDITKPTITETKEPTVLCKNQVVHKGQVIVSKVSDGSTQHE